MRQIFCLLGHSWMCAYSVWTRLELSCWWGKDFWVEYRQGYGNCAVRSFGWFPDLQGNPYFRRGFPELLLMHSLKPAYLRKASPKSGQHMCLQWQVWVALMQAQFSFLINQKQYSKRHSETYVVELLKKFYFATQHTTHFSLWERPL